ncbi:MAG TPA: endonuclease/exonuclease/phosphatase family protein [Methylibium sp.]|uniref:endonuclease/exonuclease/phosphatase family protein n=1 Tax=Methylibium sp. TaxID=2067992 RepID=UPI002DBECCB4|nr:endonuclease/exonuclease/phosphatase family protein [Methylibium sp.]HEU4458341.1 endonuclease/exonuclease/phosphatase family protein [Methylibium sp.]
MSPLRVLTVNIHKGFGFLNRRYTLAHLREAVRSTAADLVFLQEVMGAHERHAKRVNGWEATPHHEYLADALWGQFAYGRNAVYPNGDHHGNALLSKYPILRHENRDVSIAGRDGEKRGLLHCVLDVPGARQAVHAVCVHLGLGEAQRKQQLDLMCHMVSIEVPPDAALVIAGDFNDWRVRAHRILARCAGLVDVHRHAHGRSARTFPARWPLLPLDRIYVRNVESHRPIALPPKAWAHLSDHAPLAAEVTL